MKIKRKVGDKGRSTPPERFADAATESLESLDWGRACDMADGEFPEWQDVDKRFNALEVAFDPQFFKCLPRTTGESDREYQRRIDCYRMARQRDMAMAMLAVEPEAARRWAEILKSVAKPVGLIAVEKRAGFVEVVEEQSADAPTTRRADGLKVRAKKGEGGRKHGHLWHDDPATRAHDHRLLKVEFKKRISHRGKHRHSPHAVAKDMADKLRNEAMLPRDKKTIRVLGDYPLVQTGSMLYLMKLKGRRKPE